MRLRLCGAHRLPAVASLGLAAYASSTLVPGLLARLYAMFLGAPPPYYFAELASGAVTGLLALAAGYILRSLVAAATLALATLQLAPQAGLLEVAVAILVPIAGLGLLASLWGGPSEPFSVKPRLEPLLLAMAATSTYAASILGVPCGPYWALGAVASGASSLLLPGAAGAVASALAGLGWLGLLAGVLVAIVEPSRPPNCGGLRAEIHGVLSRAPIPRLLSGARGRWASTGFACTAGRGTLVAGGGRGIVVLAYGPSAREASEFIASLEGRPFVVCLACDKGYWRSRGFREETFKLDQGRPSMAPGVLLRIEAARPWEYALSTITALEGAETGLPAIIVDRADVIEGIQALVAAVDELLDHSRLVILVYPNPLKRPPPLTVPGAATAIVAAGPLPPRILESLIPLPTREAIEHAYYLLEKGYLLAYPSCRGALVATPLKGEGGREGSAS